jgi:outer membrane murein-binding lipoprotein Lpp
MKTMNVVLTIVLAVATLVMGASVPQLYSQSGRIDKAFSDISDINKAATDIAADVKILRNDMVSAQKSLGHIVDTLGQVRTSQDRLEARFSDLEVDPATVLAQYGMELGERFSAAHVAGKVYVFPKTSEGVDVLTKAGMKRFPLTPVLTGFAYEK